MCWCTPEIRTPNCGKPGCVPPAPAAPEIPGIPEGLEAVRYGAAHAKDHEYILWGNNQLLGSGGAGCGLVVRVRPGWEVLYDAPMDGYILRKTSHEVITVRFRVRYAGHAEKVLGALDRHPAVASLEVISREGAAEAE
jgi:hypothetical protein